MMYAKIVFFRQAAKQAIRLGTKIIFAAMDINCTDRELFLMKKVAHAAEEMGIPAYLVGGFVRDKLLGRPTKDMDIVCVGDGIAFAHKVSERFASPLPVTVFKNFGTAQIKTESAGDIYEIEFVGARKESYRHDSRKPSVEAGSLQDDLNRRDLTINALSVSLNKSDYGKLIDAFDGLKDLEQGLLKTPLQPDQTFSDDPLRMLRTIRFASQLGFTIGRQTWDGIVQMAERIKIISKERIADELNKILLSPKPSVGFDLLYKSGLLKIIFPQMVELAGAEYIDGKGHKDNFYHTLKVIDNIAETTGDLWLRWAALLHDIGKPATKRFEEGHGFTFHGHEIVGARMVPKIFAQLKLPSNEKMKFVQKLVEMHLRPISLTRENITDSAIRRLLFEAGDDFDSLMLLCNADITSKNPQKVKRFRENFEMVKQRCAEVEAKDHLRNWQPPISGELIMETFGLSPSREVGVIKDAIRNAILDGVVTNNFEDAYQFMIETAAAYGLAPVKQ